MGKIVAMTAPPFHIDDREATKEEAILIRRMIVEVANGAQFHIDLITEMAVNAEGNKAWAWIAKELLKNGKLMFGIQPTDPAA